MDKILKQVLEKGKNKNKGITLIALVITIIVLLILAGVTIATLTGDNGLLQKATIAKQENEKAREDELIRLAVLAAKTKAEAEGKGTITEDDLKDQLESALGKDFNEVDVNSTSYGWSYKNNYIIYKNGDVKDTSSLKLPSEYQRLEYIGNANNTQYIDTKVPITTGYRIKATLSFLNINQNYFAGAYTGKRSYTVGLYGNFVIGLQNDYAATETYDSNTIYEIDASTISGNGYFKVNGDTVVTSNQEYSIDERNCYLFKVNGLDSWGCSMKLYECMLYNEDNVLVRHFVPCKCTTKVKNTDNVDCEANTNGLYDLITEEFYTDKGNNNFNSGEEI